MKTAPSPRAATFSPAFATAAEMADAIRGKAISASELLSLTFQRIDLHNPKLNAIVWQDRQQAMARANEADAALARGNASGALHGVPVTIKESFAYQGSPSTWGLPSLAHAPSPKTAIAVQRLESAGAIVIGKTNVPVMLGDWQSYNPIYGTTNNPWDLTRTAGGSTGGGAAALTAGLGALTIGSDLPVPSGSRRTWCGYGHKPSLEARQHRGDSSRLRDGAPATRMDLSVVGPLSRSARDLALRRRARRRRPDTARAWTWRPPAPRQTSLKNFRVGYLLDDDAVPIASDVAVVYEKALEELRRAGATLERGWPRGIDPRALMSTFGYLLGALITADMNPDQRERARARVAAHPEDVFAAAAVEPHARWLHETQRRLTCRARWQDIETHDVFTPTAFTAAFPHDHSEPMAIA
jgi:amidase